MDVELTVSYIFKIFKFLKELVEKANFTFTNKGMMIQTVDTQKSAIAQFFLEPEAFSWLRVKDEIILGIDINQFFTVLKLADSMEDTLKI